MDAIGRGREIYLRRDALGVTAQHLAHEAGLSRGRIPKVEKGDPSVRESTYLAVEAALDKLERRLGKPAEDELDEPEADSPEGWVRATVTGNFNVKAVYEGPPEIVGPLVKDLFAQIHEGREEVVTTGAQRPGVDPGVYDAMRRGAPLGKSRKSRREQSGDKPDVAEDRS